MMHMNYCKSGKSLLDYPLSGSHYVDPDIRAVASPANGGQGLARIVAGMKRLRKEWSSRLVRNVKSAHSGLKLHEVDAFNQ